MTSSSPTAAVDKQTATDLFELLQRAFDQLRAGGVEAEEATLGSEKGELLFARSAEQHIHEASPADFQRILAVQNRTREQLQDEGTGDDDVAIYLVMLYAPTCSMSRMVVPFLEIAASRLFASASTRDVKVVAFGCGLWKVNQAPKRLKGGAWTPFEDSLCKRLGMTETPQLFALSGPASRDMSKNAGPPLRMVFTHGGENENLSDRFFEFARKAHRYVRYQALIKTITSQVLEGRENEDPENSYSFGNFFRSIFAKDESEEGFERRLLVVLFLDTSSVGKDTSGLKTETGDTQVPASEAFSALVNAAPHLRHAGAHVGVMYCGEGTEENTTPIDYCETSEKVTSFPDVLLYAAGKGQGKGVSLLDAPFEDIRDIEIALRVAATTLVIARDSFTSGDVAEAGALQEMGDEFREYDDVEREGDEAEADGSCSDMPPGKPPDGPASDRPELSSRSDGEEQDRLSPPTKERTETGSSSSGAAIKGSKPPDALPSSRSESLPKLSKRADKKKDQPVRRGGGAAYGGGAGGGSGGGNRAIGR